MTRILASICYVGNAILNTNIYASGLALTKGKKTCAEIARTLCKSHDSVLRNLKRAVHEREDVRKELYRRVQCNINPNGALVIDATVAVKEYARKIEGVSRQYGGGKRAPGISVTAFSYTDLQGGKLEPFDTLVWKKGDRPKNRTAIERGCVAAQQLGVHSILMDAEYSTIYSWNILLQASLYAVMRFHCNRSVYVEGFGKAQLKHHEAFKFQRNQRMIIRKVLWQKLTLHVIAIKRFHPKKRKFITTFLVTNAPAKKVREYAAFYRHRWKIEPFFRQSKQVYGLAQCQARSLEMQEAHFLAILLAHSNAIKNTPAIPQQIKPRRRYITPFRKKRRLKTRKQSLHHAFFATA